MNIEENYLHLDKPIIPTRQITLDVTSTQLDKQALIMTLTLLP